MSRNLEYGRVYTSRIQKPHFSGLGVYDPEKVFYREDPDGKVYVDDKLVKIVKTKDESNLVMIGDKLYKFVTIGDQTWLAENLDFVPEGVELKTSGSDVPTTPMCCYYNYTPNDKGLLYNVYTFDAINQQIPSGWRLPTAYDYEILFRYIGGNTVDNIKKIRSTMGWPNTQGTDEYGLSLVPGGNRSSNGLFITPTTCYLWTNTGESTYSRISINDTSSAGISSFVKEICYSIRLIKDDDPVEIGGKTYKTAKIGSQIWTIENLDYYVDGAVYYNNNPTDSYGLLYSPTAVDALDGIVEGWHVPYAGEIDELSNFVSDNSKLLKSRTSWATNPGTDNYRFAANAGGSYNSTVFSNKGYYGLFYSQTKNTSNQNYRMNLADNSNTITCGYVNNNNYLSVRLIKDTEPVEIGGKKYKTQKIGNQLWMSENLDYIFEGLNVGGETLQDDVHAWYYNNDPEQSEGLLYNGYAAKYLAEHPELLPDGWKVPESSDFGKLQVAVGGANTAGTHLKNPGTMNGINYYGFNGIATGMIRSNGQFTDRTTYLRLWTPNISQTDETAQQFLTLESDKTTATVVSFPNDQTVAYSIRLVKNLSDENSLSKGLLSTVIEDKGKEDIDEKSVEDEKKTEEIKNDEKETIKEENKR